jgi:hypothetical protein
VNEQDVHALVRRTWRHPESASLDLLHDLVSAIQRRGMSPGAADVAGRLLRTFLFEPIARETIGGMMRLLRTPDLSPHACGALLRTLRYARTWRPDLLDLDAILDLAACDHLASHRGFLLRYLVEPLMLAGVARPVPALFGEEAKYLRYLLGQGGAFPLHARVRVGLQRGPKRVLAVHNIDDGQGDELVRMVPLLQSLLDCNPELEIVALTRRLYLYDHPRVRPVSIRDEAAANELLAQRFDLVIDFFETNVMRVNYVPGLELRLRAHVGKARPFLFLSAIKGYNHFVFHTVAIDGRNFAARLGLDRARTGGIYDPTLRLIAELGLPARVGQQKPAAGSILTGAALPEADRLWESLVGGTTRPIAIVSPFGGREPLKGYTAPAFPDLARELEALVDEGFTVLLLPNGTPWGNASAAREVAARIDPGRRHHLRLAPDPAGEPDAADRVMRSFKYLVERSDLAVSVEGWMTHMAYLLGRPYRMVMLPYSHPPQWHPSPASGNQRVLPSIALRDTVFPAPRYPRKDQLLLVLDGLRTAPIDEAARELDAAMASPDRQIREAAVRAWTAHLPDARARDALLQGLRDKAGPVRLEAAAAFLDRRIDLTRELGGDYEPILRCHSWIAERRWGEVLRAGKVAHYPLCVAMDDEDDVIRGEASWAFQQLTTGASLARRSWTPDSES